MKKQPIISVLMCVYNAEPFLGEAIESILSQTYSQFEFIIINDCSTDSSLKIIKSYSDKRIKLINNDRNIGLTKSLNIGLKNCNTKYIARIDADDIALSNRLEKQILFLENNPKIGVLGTQAWYNGRFLKYKTKHPTKNNLLKWQLFFHNPIIHPTVMFRKNVIMDVNGYNENKRVGQDYELWTRLFNKTEFANLEQPYLFLRKHSNNISVKHAFEQQLTAIKTIQSFLKIVLKKEISHAAITNYFFHKFKSKLERKKASLFINELYNYFSNNFIVSNDEKKRILKHKKKIQREILYPLYKKIINLINI